MSTQTGVRLAVRSHDRPDEFRTPSMATVEVVHLGAQTVGRFTFQPGWTWATSVRPIAGTDHCEKTHIGYCVSGSLDVWLTDGTQVTINPGDSYTIPPGHDAAVHGTQPFVGIEWESADTYAKR